MCSAQKFKNLCLNPENINELNNILNSLFDPSIDLKSIQTTEIIKYIRGGLDFEVFKETGENLYSRLSL